MIFGLTFIFLTARLSPLPAETRAECIQRLSRISTDSLVLTEKSDIYISTETLERQPLLLRNLVAHLWMNPYISAFFGARDAGLKELYEIERAFEFRRAFVELDRMQSYSLGEVVEVLQRLGLKSESFILDLSEIETRGLRLKFLNTHKKSDFARKFALAWTKWLMRQTAPLNIKPIPQLSFSTSVQIPEDVFVLHQIKEKMRTLVVEELLLPWSAFEKMFGNLHPEMTIDVPVNSHTENWSFMLRSSAREYIIEIRAEGSLPKAGHISLNGKAITWIKKNGVNIGLVQLPAANQFQIEWKSLEESGRKNFQWEMSKLRRP